MINEVKWLCSGLQERESFQNDEDFRNYLALVRVHYEGIASRIDYSKHWTELTDAGFDVLQSIARFLIRMKKTFEKNHPNVLGEDGYMVIVHKDVDGMVTYDVWF